MRISTFSPDSEYLLLRSQGSGVPVLVCLFCYILPPFRFFFPFLPFLLPPLSFLQKNVSFFSDRDREKSNVP